MSRPRRLPNPAIEDRTGELLITVADKQTIDLPPEDAGTRLDRFLAKRLDLPRNQIQQWIRAGHVQVGGAIVEVNAAPGFSSSVTSPFRSTVTASLERGSMIVMSNPALTPGG